MYLPVVWGLKVAMELSERSSIVGGPASDASADEPQAGQVAVWICRAPSDPIAHGLIRQLAHLGLGISLSPESAEQAVIVLSPELAEADPQIEQWVRARGVHTLVLTLSSGRASWDDEAHSFTGDSDAIPTSLRAAFSSRPIVLDLRGADQAKLGRVARRLTGALSQLAPGPPAVAGTEPPAGMAPTESPSPPPPPRRRRRRRIIVGVGVAALVTGIALTWPAGSGSDSSSDSQVASATTAVEATVPSTAAPDRSTTTRGVEEHPPPLFTERGSPGVGSLDQSARWLPWALVAVLAVALSFSLAERGRKSTRDSVKGHGSGDSPTSDPSPAQVFISHDADADGRVARTVADGLLARQLRVWLAPDSIPPGDVWVFAIEQALVTSRAAIVLVSPAALASGWVRREIQLIVDLEIDGRLHVVPVLVAPCKLPLVLTAYQWVPLREFDRAAEDLSRRFVPAGVTA